MAFGIGVEDYHPYSIWFSGSQNHWKLVVVDTSDIDRKAHAAVFREFCNLPPLRRQRLIQRLPWFLGGVEHVDAVALHRYHCRQRSHLPQAFCRTEGQIEPRRIAPINDIHIMVAWDQQHGLSERGKLADSIDEFGPFCCATGISHISADKHEVDWTRGMDSRQAR